MPHIHVTLLSSVGEEFRLVRDNRTEIRAALSEVTGYYLDDIALIPRILSDGESELTENFYTLCFVADLGVMPEEGLDDLIARQFTEKLLAFAPGFKKINFGVWIKQHPSNGRYEHKPRQ